MQFHRVAIFLADTFEIMDAVFAVRPEASLLGAVVRRFYRVRTDSILPSANNGPVNLGDWNREGAGETFGAVEGALSSR
jgi:hypothetical protein